MNQEQKKGLKKPPLAPFGALIALIVILLFITHKASQPVEENSSLLLKEALKSAAKLDHAYQSYFFHSFKPRQALEDPDNRISPDFKVPKNLFY